MDLYWYPLIYSPSRGKIEFNTRLNIKEIIGNSIQKKNYRDKMVVNFHGVKESVSFYS